MQELRTVILDESYKILNTKGVDAIRMRELARVCRCAVGTLYNAFKTFEEIHFHLNLRTFKTLFNHLFAALQKESGSLEEVLPKIGWEYISFAKEHTHSWKSLFEFPPKGVEPKWYRDEVNTDFLKMEKFLKTKYKLSEEKAERLISYFWFSIHGVCSIVLNKKASNHSDEFIESYVDHCLRGIYTQTTWKIEP